MGLPISRGADDPEITDSSVHSSLAFLSSTTMSSSSSQPNSASQQQQQQRVRKPPFADWPTIKILTPPQGKSSYGLHTDS
jgi:hypothetical protein